MKKISLSEKEVELLLMVLEECSDTRSGMGCNDPYDDEEKLFTKKERIEMQKVTDEMDDEDIDGYLANFQYVDYLIEKIKKQQ